MTLHHIQGIIRKYKQDKTILEILYVNERQDKTQDYRNHIDYGNHQYHSEIFHMESRH